MYMTKNSGQKFKYLENEKSFQDEIEGIFHLFYGAFILWWEFDFKQKSVCLIV